MAKYSLRRNRKRHMFDASGNNRNAPPLKDAAGHIMNKAGYNKGLVDQKIMRRVSETTEILKDKTIDELQELLDLKGVEAFKKYNDEGSLIDVDVYFRTFSTTDKHAIRQLIEFKKRKQAQDKEKETQEVEKPEISE